MIDILSKRFSAHLKHTKEHTTTRICDDFSAVLLLILLACSVLHICTVYRELLGVAWATLTSGVKHLLCGELGFLTLPEKCN